MNRSLRLVVATFAACLAGDPHTGQLPAKGPVPFAPPESGGVVTNLGFSIKGSPMASGNRFLVLLAEQEQGIDLNGDGDQLDTVPHLYEASTATLTSFELALAPPRFGIPPDPVFDGNWIVTLTTEAGQGATDLNGDGDAVDDVLTVFDVAAREGASLGLAVPRATPFIIAPSIELVGGNLLAHGGEAEQGTDLNGDGDTDDRVLQWFRLGANAGLRSIAGGGVLPGGARQLRRPPAVGGNLFLPLVGIQANGFHGVFSVDEFQQQADLNGDGDQTDRVLHLADFAGGHLVNLGEELSPWLLGDDFVVTRAENGVDLNGDGDTNDLTIVHTYDLATGQFANLGLASFSLRPVEAEDLVLVLGWESKQTDLNGDGDQDDYVLHVHDHATGVTTNTGLATTSLPYAAGNLIPLLVSESGQGVDLNGDGDTADDVIHFWNRTSGTAVNLGAALRRLTPPEERLIALTVCELDQSEDWNGDGDGYDEVLVLYDRVTGAFVNTGLDAGVVHLDGTLALLLVDEKEQGNLDLNGDGDKNDFVFHLYDVATATTTNLGLAGGGGSANSVGGTTLFTVNEAAQRQDLNGDGDQLDLVAHLLELR